MQRGSREGLEGGGVMACGRIVEVVLLIYDFSTFLTVGTAEFVHGSSRGKGERERG